MKKHELDQIIKEEISKVLDEVKGRRFIPPVIEFPKTQRDYFKEHFRLMKNSEGEYRLYISPLMKVALDAIKRGRTPKDYLQVTPELVKGIAERIPTQVRSILNKYSEKINPGLQMFSVNSKIKEVTPDGTIIFYNPGNPKTADLAYDPTVR